MERYTHEPVMLEECLQALNIRPGGLYVDGTAGLGGHSEAIARRLDGGTLYGFDKDAEALEYCRGRLAPFGEAVCLIHSDFRCMAAALAERGVERVDGILLDLGVSSLQLDKPERGFSFRHDARLDMRMDTRDGVTARELVNTLTARELRTLFYELGEERRAPRIAEAIVRNRPVETTAQLAGIVISAIQGLPRGGDTKHPARRVFQALRMAVNDETGALREGLESAVALLKPGARAAVLTFHSLEDRAVKNMFSAAASACECPRDFPQCVCGKRPALTRHKRQTPSEEEIERNPRSESAKLRWAEKL
ncbi:MAG: 16S rRNA (cytosine(1402)-N(4))-methyltransferase RsmH [Oscillospiraceae bacterium]|nr:16S rRNA (cytosine(1402)-N(4))-methyltransferase RsmH [Oscillospiraceae bacterium]